MLQAAKSNNNTIEVAMIEGMMKLFASAKDLMRIVGSGVVQIGKLPQMQKLCADLIEGHSVSQNKENHHTDRLFA